MNKIILLIGLLTYSSVGWSKSLVMECVDPIISLNGIIYKLETDEDVTSKNLLTKRKNGEWESVCLMDNWVCRKGDDSIILSTKPENPGELTIVYDFKFLRVSTKGVIEGTSNDYDTRVDFVTRCKRITP